MPPSTQSTLFLATDIVLLVTGLVGSGRSTFVNALLPQGSPEKMDVGSALSTCTKKVQYVIIDLGQHLDPQVRRNNRLIVVDTPGFDDPDTQDVTVLHDILTWLHESFPSSKSKGAIIYLHDISKDTYQGIKPVHCAKVLDRSVNTERYSQLVIATTKWIGTGLSEERCQWRHDHLTTTRWNRVLSSGSRVHAFKRDEDAWQIVKEALPYIEAGKELDFGKQLASIKATRKKSHQSVMGDGWQRIGSLCGATGNHSW